jgi:hypothetical protein
MQPQPNTFKSIQETDLSPEYKIQSEQMGILSLGDFLYANIPLLRQHPDFTMLWYTELLKILKQEHLLDEFQSRL